MPLIAWRQVGDQRLAAKAEAHGEALGEANHHREVERDVVVGQSYPVHARPCDVEQPGGEAKQVQQ